MAHDDWRVRVELEGAEHAGGLLDRLRGRSEGADELVRQLRHERLAVSREEASLFVYADSMAQAERARALVDAEAHEHGLSVEIGPVEHWLGDEDRWDDEPAGPDVEEEEVAEGVAPWEVRVECESHGEAESLADELSAEGYDVLRRWRYLLVGASSQEEAEALAKRLHGDAEPTSEVVWEVMPENPFAVFGGLGS